MRRLLPLLIVIHAFSVHAACPETAPGLMSLETIESCDAETGCPNGPVTLLLEPLPWMPMPPEPYDPGYTIAPCDVVEWEFGDGTTQIVSGSDRVTHDYPLPGNYTVRATVTNALGSKTVTTTVVVATSPSRLSFVTSTFKVVFPAFQSTCNECVEVHEGVPATITVMRTLDLSRALFAVATITIEALPVNEKKIRVPLRFAPGETQKTFTITIPDDRVYSGIRYARLELENARGGTLTRTDSPWRPALVILDDEPVPTVSLPPAIRVAEGDAGLTNVSLPVTLTAPMGVDVFTETYYNPWTATDHDFTAGIRATIKAGETSGEATVWIRGNTKPEPDKVFTVRIAPRHTNADPIFGTTTALVTIVNDDAAVYPAKTSAAIGTSIRLTLDIGSPYAVPTTVQFTTSDAGVAPAPSPVVIPAGATTVGVLVEPRAIGIARLGAIVPDRTTAPAEIVAVAGRRRTAKHSS